MSFRKKVKSVRLVRLPANNDGMMITPAKGTNTLYWWRKGDDTDGWWVKSELYDVNGNNIECLMGDTLDHLQLQLKNDFGLSIFF